MEGIISYFISISALSGVSIFLGKLIITKSFDLGLENYKANLTKEIEDHKNLLSKLSLEHQVKFTKLHDERAEKIKTLYSKVIELEGALIHSTTVAQGPEYITDNARDEACIQKLRDLIGALDHDRIYFSLTTIQKFESIIKESWEIIFQMRKVRTYGAALDKYAKQGREAPERYYSETDLWGNAYEKTTNEFKTLKDELADEFRKLLGI